MLILVLRVNHVETLERSEKENSRNVPDLSDRSALLNQRSAQILCPLRETWCLHYDGRGYTPRREPVAVKWVRAARCVRKHRPGLWCVQCLQPMSACPFSPSAPAFSPAPLTHCFLFLHLFLFLTCPGNCSFPSVLLSVLVKRVRRGFVLAGRAPSEHGEVWARPGSTLTGFQVLYSPLAWFNHAKMLNLESTESTWIWYLPPKLLCSDRLGSEKIAMDLRKCSNILPLESRLQCGSRAPASPCPGPSLQYLSLLLGCACSGGIRMYWICKYSRTVFVLWADYSYVSEWVSNCLTPSSSSYPPTTVNSSHYCV